MTAEEQLALWVAGEPRCPNEHGECCPDFSCCRPELLVDEGTRKAFVAADERVRLGFLGAFLGAALEGKPVHIAKGDPPS